MTSLLDCGHAPSPHSSFTTGYGTDPATGATFCYECAAARDRDAMIVSGRATLYMVEGGTGKIGLTSVTNWPSSLTFRIHKVNVSRHNIAGRRYDAWFVGPDGFTWHAVTYGDNTQIAHCRRVTSRRSDDRRLSPTERAEYARQRDTARAELG